MHDQIGSEELCLLVLSFLVDPVLLGSCAVVCARWKDLARHEQVWDLVKKLVMGSAAITSRPRALIEDSPPSASMEAPDGSSFSICRDWAVWLRGLGLSLGTPECKFTVTHFDDALVVWQSLLAWFGEHAPDTEASIMGAGTITASDWIKFRAIVDQHLPAEEASAPFRGLWVLRLLHAIQDGQTGEIGEQVNGTHNYGMLGGYSAYHHSVSSFLFDLEHVGTWTSRFSQQLVDVFGEEGRWHLPIASNTFDASKFFFIDVRDGSIHTFGPMRSFLPAHPPRCSADEATAALVSSDVSSSKAAALAQVALAGSSMAAERDAPDGMLRWLAALASCVESGKYAAATIHPGENEPKALNLLPCRDVAMPPRVPPAGGSGDGEGASGAASQSVHFTRRVTRGVEAKASVVWWPEQGQSSYSIQLRILRPDEEGGLSEEERGFSTCQLKSRHWTIVDGDGHTEHVRGDGVIGKYPLLKVGGYRDDEQNRFGTVGAGRQCSGTFVYQSCSGRARGTGPGSFGGELSFIPGSIKQPTGAPFDVIVLPFSLDTPLFVF